VDTGACGVDAGAAARGEPHPARRGARAEVADLARGAGVAAGAAVTRVGGEGDAGPPQRVSSAPQATAPSPPASGVEPPVSGAVPSGSIASMPASTAPGTPRTDRPEHARTESAARRSERAAWRRMGVMPGPHAPPRTPRGARGSRRTHPSESAKRSCSAVQATAQSRGNFRERAFEAPRRVGPCRDARVGADHQRVVHGIGRAGRVGATRGRHARGSRAPPDQGIAMISSRRRHHE
jgi:hypothetical protein